MKKIKKIKFHSAEGYGSCEPYYEGYIVYVFSKGVLEIEFENGESIKIPVEIHAQGDDLKKGHGDVLIKIK